MRFTELMKIFRRSDIDKSLDLPSRRQQMYPGTETREIMDFEKRREKDIAQSDLQNQDLIRRIPKKEITGGHAHRVMNFSNAIGENLYKSLSLQRMHYSRLPPNRCGQSFEISSNLFSRQRDCRQGKRGCDCSLVN